MSSFVCVSMCLLASLCVGACMHLSVYVYIYTHMHVIIILPLPSQTGGHSMEDLAAIESQATVASNGHQTITSHDLPLVPHVDTRHLESLDSSEVDLEDVLPQGTLYQVAVHQSANQKPRPRHARGRYSIIVKQLIRGSNINVDNSILMIIQDTVLPLVDPHQ